MAERRKKQNDRKVTQAYVDKSKYRADGRFTKWYEEKLAAASVAEALAQFGGALDQNSEYVRLLGTTDRSN